MFRFGNNVLNDIPDSGPMRLWDSQTEWASLQPNEHVWNWYKLDNIVNSANGRNIVLVLGHPPEWAAKGGSDGKQAPWMPPGSNRPPRDSVTWWNYVSTVVQRYKGKISHYQIWNEPVDDAFYSGTYKELALYVRRARDIVKQFDPDAKVISPPLQPRKQAKWKTEGLYLYRALKNQKFPFDIWAAHIYPQIGEGIDAWSRDVIKVQKRIGKTKNLWITETNFNLMGPNNPYPSDLQEIIKKKVENVSFNLDIPRVFWYAYHYPNPSMIGITNT